MVHAFKHVKGKLKCVLQTQLQGALRSCQFNCHEKNASKLPIITLSVAMQLYNFTLSNANNFTSQWVL